MSHLIIAEVNCNAIAFAISPKDNSLTQVKDTAPSQFLNMISEMISANLSQFSLICYDFHVQKVYLRKAGQSAC
jgi:hypothetical protein